MASENCRQKLDLYLGENTTNYLHTSGMAQSNTWATDAEILAVAHLLQVDLCVWSMVGKISEWLRYTASFSLTQPARYTLLLENQLNHFNVVIQ